MAMQQRVIMRVEKSKRGIPNQSGNRSDATLSIQGEKKPPITPILKITF